MNRCDLTSTINHKIKDNQFNIQKSMEVIHTQHKTNQQEDHYQSRSSKDTETSIKRKKKQKIGQTDQFYCKKLKQI